MPAVAYIFAQQILALITVVNPNYVIQGYQGALMTIASATSAIALSVFVMQRLTLAEGLAVVVHCFGFVAFLAILWVMGTCSHPCGALSQSRQPLTFLLLAFRTESQRIRHLLRFRRRE